MRITYSFASRSRPKEFFAALDNIREMSASSNYEIIAKLDLDDPAMNTREVLTLIETYPELKVIWGLSKNKIHAVNRGLGEMTGSILMAHSDDMVFIKKGFDDIIREEITKAEYLHFPDGYANERLCTYPIMTAWYYRSFGYIYHPDYKSLWCDNEQTEVAKIVGAYRYVPEQIFEHRHPAAGKGKMDAQYRKSEKDGHGDKATYLKRKAKGFDITKTLSILICGLTSRGESLSRLINVLSPQLTPQVEVKLCIDNGQAKTGTKRNALLDAANGKYVVFIDDDDLISDTYVSDILQAARNKTDAIVFNGWMTTNGKNKKHFRLSKDYPYTTDNDVYLRYPNHIVPIRARIAKQFKFPDVTHGEDYAWATEIHKSGLITTETKIEKDLYYYLYQSK